MAVSKALRFQVMRRDGFRCQYCGATAADGASLVVDHVLPVALGGQDSADNLTTSCASCNSGKGSMPPDAENVAQVDQRNAEWAAAMQRAKSQANDERENRWRIHAAFMREWDDWPYAFGGKPYPLPDNFADAVETWIQRGLTIDDLRELIAVTMSKQGLSSRDRFRYFAGCCWRRIGQLEDEAARIMGQSDGD